MDIRTIDEEGLTVCPQCGKHYRPVLGERPNNRPVSVAFPKAKPFEREQLMTGLCSDKCWDKYLGVKPVRP